MSASDVAELLPFLDDARANVREMAAEGLAGFTSTPEGTNALISHGDGLYKALLKLCIRAKEGADCTGAAMHAAAACVNLSQLPAERIKLIAAGAIDAAAECVGVEEPRELGEYAGMLLCNLTSFEKAVEQLVEAEGGTVAGKLLRLLAAAPVGDEERHAHLALVLTNVAQHPRARAQLLAAMGDVIERLCDHLGSGSEESGATRRLGLARLLRNVCFGAKPAAAEVEESAEAAAARMALLDTAVLRPLLVRLAARLSPLGVAYDADDRARMAPELLALVADGRADGGDASEVEAGDGCNPDVDRGGGGTMVVGDTGGEDGGGSGGGGGGSQSSATPREPQMEARLAITEALMLLTAAKPARVMMRELGIYFCLREAHLLEEDADGVPTPVREANENLVEIFYLSAEATGPPPSMPSEAADEPRIEELEKEVQSAEIVD